MADQRIHIGAAFDAGWKAFKVRPGFWVPLTTAFWVIPALLRAALDFLPQQFGGFIGLAVFGIIWAISIYVTVLVSHGIILCALLTVRGRRPEFKDAFEINFSFPFLFNLLILSIFASFPIFSLSLVLWILIDDKSLLSSLSTGLIIMLTIAVIYGFCRLFPAIFLIVERKFSFYTSIRAAFKVTSGHTLRIFISYILSLLLYYVSFIVFVCTFAMKGGKQTAVLDNIFLCIPSIAIFLAATTIILIAFTKIYLQIEQSFVSQRLSVSSLELTR